MMRKCYPPAHLPRSHIFMQLCKKMMDTVRVPSIPGWLEPIDSIDFPLARGIRRWHSTDMERDGEHGCRSERRGGPYVVPRGPA
jgi:hypothetical protein